MGKFWKLTVAAGVAGALFAANAGADRKPAAPQFVPPASAAAPVGDSDWTQCMLESLVKRATAGLILPGAFDAAETECEPQAKLARAVRDINRAQWFALRTMLKTDLIASAAQVAAREYLRR